MSLINFEGQEKEILNEKKVVLDFSAGWCGPCKMFKPIFEQTAKEYPNIEFIKIDIDQSEEITQEYHIMSVPTIVLLENGQEIKRRSGFMPKEEFEEFLK